jgi:aspartate carbamoyltransferase catalytic subunit
MLVLAYNCACIFEERWIMASIPDVGVLPFRHIVSARQFDKNIIKNIFAWADKFRENNWLFDSMLMQYRVMATYFGEPSTRTRLSFETAMQRLGGNIISIENGSISSSEAKGESLHDTIKTISQYSDVIVIRHPEEGAAKIASEASDAPVINAGDGGGEHPTQALLDLYTIWKERKGIDNTNVVIFGDTTKARAVKSLITLLRLYQGVDVNVIDPYVSPTSNTWQHELKDKLKFADVVYITRLQRERWTPGFSATNPVYFGQNELKIMKPSAIILHPLPRNNEIDSHIDQDPRAAYWRQVKNGLYLRMALIKMINFSVT